MATVPLAPQNLHNWQLVQYELNKKGPYELWTNPINKKIIVLELFFLFNSDPIPVTSDYIVSSGSGFQDNREFAKKLLLIRTKGGKPDYPYESNLRYLLGIGVVPEFLAYTPEYFQVYDGANVYEKGLLICLQQKNEQ